MHKEDLKIIGFATTVCVICSLCLSLAASGLKEKREMNEKVDRLSNVLQAFGEPVRDVAGKRLMQGPDVLAYFEGDAPAIVEVLIDDEGQILEGKTRADFKEDLIADETNAPYPLYRWKKEDGSTFYCFPMSGPGLWSTVYSYMALEKDLETIKGVTFYGHKETPGLGGECSKPWFMDNFKGQTIIKDGKPVSFEVMKGKVVDKYPNGNQSAVDGMAGATITAKGIEDFINEDVKKYNRYFQTLSGS